MAKKKAIKRRSNKAKSGAQIDLALPAAALKMNMKYIARNLIEPDPDQPREEPDADLRDSIRREGILEPITVRPHPKKSGLFMIHDGERRWKGADGVQNSIPCIVRDDMEDELHRIITQLIANTGKPLEPIEEARAFRRAMELSQKGVTEIADMIGRPRSSVGDRLALLDLGPWTALVEAGKVPISHVVRVVVPLRGVPAQFHVQAVEALKQDGLFDVKEGVSLEELKGEVGRKYREFLYPLTTVQNGLKNPTFNTRNHDKECECGGVTYEIDFGKKRRCCGNPDWWKPLHKKAVAEQKKAAPKKKHGASNGTGQKKIYLPEGTKSIRMNDYGPVPKGMVAVSDHGARTFSSYQIDFDPREISPSEYVLVETKGSGPVIAVKAGDSVQAARKEWAKRWTDRGAALCAQLIAPNGPASKQQITGDGCRGILLHLFDTSRTAELFELAASLGIAVPTKLMSGPRWQIEKAELQAWVDSLDAGAVSQMLSVIAAIEVSGDKSPIEQVEVERKRVVEKIRGTVPPWLKKPVAGASASGKKARNGKSPAAVKPDVGEDDRVRDADDPTQQDLLEEDDDAAVEEDEEALAGA